MKIEEQVSLKSLNTFGIDVFTQFFASFNSTGQLIEILSINKYQNLPHLVLGGGSNILFTKNYDGIVLKNNIPGIDVVDEDENFVYVKAGGGVNWHALVLFCIRKGYGGIENLSLIPGNTGASPIQNIGAYGVELKDSFYSLEAININTGLLKIYNNSDCQFGYRDSVFKKEMKGKLIISSVTLKLQKHPQLNVSYGAIQQELLKVGIENPTVIDISNAVCNIRRSKLPDPAVIGNAGSFFKNPEILKEHFEELKMQWPGLVAYQLSNGNFKLAAGWMIEQCGWKGKISGQTGSHKDQALVLVNYGDATGLEILELANMIRDSVMKKFGVNIETEVNII